MNANEVLQILERTNALLTGHFELRSGLHSEQFFQCAMVCRYPDITADLCSALADAMRSGMTDAPVVDGVIAPAIGGIVVGHEMARALGVRSIFAEKKGDNLVLRRGFAVAPGENFIVAEDVITRGGRVQQTIDIVKQAGGKVAAVAVIVDRSGGRAKFGCPFYSLVEIEPVTFDPKECPLCARGDPVVHPGS